MRLQAAVEIAHHPHPYLRALHAGLAVETQAVLDLEARAAEADFSLHRHVVAEMRGSEEARVCARQRIAGEVEGLEQLHLGHARRALEQRRSRGVENLEIARIVNMASRVAVAPF